MNQTKNIPSETIAQFQRERANLVDHLSAARRLLGATKGVLEANKLMNRVSPFSCPFSDQEQTLLDRINEYTSRGMFDQLPEGTAR